MANPPENCSREYRYTPTVGSLKKYLKAHPHHRFRLPIYKVNVKYFDESHPLVINYVDDDTVTVKRPRWIEYIGRVHAVCLYFLHDVKGALVGDHSSWIKTFDTPVPIHNGRPPINDSLELAKELCRFDDSLPVALVWVDRDMNVHRAETLCELTSCSGYWDGAGCEYVYTDDGQHITAARSGGGQWKVELDGHFLGYPAVFTNVSDEFVRKRVSKNQDDS